VQEFADGDPLADRVLPCANVVLNFNLGDPFGLSHGGPAVLRGEPAHVIGPVTRPARMHLADRAAFFGVIFHPGGAEHFLRTPIHELTDQFLALDDLWGTAGRALQARVLEAATMTQRVRLVEDELRRRLAATRHPDRTVSTLAGHVARQGGLTTVARLSAASGFTRQHLARTFRRAMGVSPKLYCRLVRFQHAMIHALGPPPHDWAAAAARLGYYDQAHLIAEFKEFTGLTPATFASGR
jgi:AraC-like DNA-binding protein